MSTQTFARVFGIVFLIIGAAGFVPGLLTEHSHADITFDAGLGFLFGVFAVNAAHNAVHLLFGVWGLVASRSMSASAAYGKVVGVSYALLTILGLIPAAKLWTLFGFVPLYGHDIWLHALLAAVATYYGFVPHKRVTVEETVEHG
jgi:hypothetical protein